MLLCCIGGTALKNKYVYERGHKIIQRPIVMYDYNLNLRDSLFPITYIYSDQKFFFQKAAISQKMTTIYKPYIIPEIEYSFTSIVSAGACKAFTAIVDHNIIQPFHSSENRRKVKCLSPLFCCYHGHC